MNFPVWDLGFAHGLLIAVVAITHVFVSHFAVGGGLYLVVTEHLARRRNDTALLAALHGHARFFILLTLVFGAISGVGIWFTIGLINPGGTSSLIRAFVWGWAIEWVFFIVEIAAAMIYYYGWSRLSPRNHLAVGWIYFVAAWLSMVIINGILSFQLTPGQWIESRDFWDGFFNPTYWPSLLTRTFFALSLAGLFAVWSAARHHYEGTVRRWFMRYAGVWSIVGLAGSVLLSLWWWSSLPEGIRVLTSGDMPFATMLTRWIPILTAFLALLIVLGPLTMPRLVRAPAGLVLLAAGFMVMGAGEWIREAVRKPWVIHGYLYSNGYRSDEVEQLREDGIVANAKWLDQRTLDDPLALGEELFRVACANCHSRAGYNGMAQRIQDWDVGFAAGMIERIEYTRRQMPPWIGTRVEAEVLAIYLMSLKAPQARFRSGPTRGVDVFETRCAPCHSLDGQRAIRELVEGLGADDLDEYIESMGSDYMPEFTGNAEERRALAEYLEAVGEGTEAQTVVELPVADRGPSVMAASAPANVDQDGGGQ